mmetsp:Transcript_53691/g.173366  ORF Transcript_53691/g.173366 Transcript_53691/m.173366 type:complete len:310 (-) Transcript_53691:181-1110(-)
MRLCWLSCWHCKVCTSLQTAANVRASSRTSQRSFASAAAAATAASAIAESAPAATSPARRLSEEQRSKRAACCRSFPRSSVSEIPSASTRGSTRAPRREATAASTSPLTCALQSSTAAARSARRLASASRAAPAAAASVCASALPRHGAAVELEAGVAISGAAGGGPAEGTAASARAMEVAKARAEGDAAARGVAAGAAESERTIVGLSEDHLAGQADPKPKGGRAESTPLAEHSGDAGGVPSCTRGPLGNTAMEVAGKGSGEALCRRGAKASGRSSPLRATADTAPRAGAKSSGGGGGHRGEDAGSAM